MEVEVNFALGSLFEGGQALVDMNMGCIRFLQKRLLNISAMESKCRSCKDTQCEYLLIEFVGAYL